MSANFTSKFKSIACVSMLLACMSNGAIAQEAPKKSKEGFTYKPLKLNLNESGSQYVRFIVWNQIQLEKSKGVDGAALSLRRSRMIVTAQLSPRFSILTHIGLNSLGASGLTGNPNTQTANNASLFFLHDAWGEYAILPNKLHVGAGLHYWNGVSRMTNASTLNFMTMDNPGSGVADARLFPWGSITTNDQFGRHMGIFAKGTIGHFAYRVAANNSRKNMGTLNDTLPSYQVDGTGKYWDYSGYFNYNFFDVEPDALPYMVGTYLGAKKVLSVGVGFNTAPKAIKTGHLNTNNEAVYTSEKASTFLGADVFYDAPVGNKGHAVNAMLAYYGMNYGGSKIFNTGGLIPGSGSIIYAQAGYFIPFKTKGQGVMPYATFSNQNFDITPNTSNELGIGLNYFLAGHNAKLTAEFNSGKKGTATAINDNKFRLQLHMFL